MAEVDRLRYDADTLIARSGGLYPPSSVIISWPTPNYVNPETRDWTAPIVLISVTGITFIVLVARIWARVVVAKNAGLDDLFMAIAMIPLVGLTITVVLGVRTYGFQWHTWDQTPRTLVTSRQITLAIEVLYVTSTSLIKISILCFYRRITSGTISKAFLYWVWASIIFVACYAIIFIFVGVFSCYPVEGFWHLLDISWRLTHEVKCHNEAAQIVSAVIISTLQDLFICALPIVLIWNLQISKRQKAALICIFGLGLLTCVCGIMRTYYAIYVYYYTYDITWYAFYEWIWTALEANLGVICASAPALNVFFRRYFTLPTINSSTNDYSRRKTPQFGLASAALSTATSNLDSGRWDTTPVPLDPTRVSAGRDLTIEHRDEVIRQGSSSSTGSLTALPSLPSPTRSSLSHWAEGCRTVYAAFRPESRSSSRNKSRDMDIERYAEGN